MEQPHINFIGWGVSLRVRMRFRELLAELVDLEDDPDTPERTDRMFALREDIRALPNFPVRYDVDRDVIMPVTTSTQR